MDIKAGPQRNSGNPCNVDKIFRRIKQFGAPARQAGGVCGVEMALMDLAGKAWGVPCWQLLGGRFRDRVRLYADTTSAPDPKAQAARLKERMDRGITFLKQDFGIGLIEKEPGALSYPPGTNLGGGGQVMHPFTGIEITDKGLDLLSAWVGTIREVIGMEIPLSTDHYGHISVNSCIKLARAMEKWNLAWMEDMVPWQFGDLVKQIKESTTTPILTGEDIYLKGDFAKLIDMGAVDMIHPDLASSGGLIETEEDRGLRDGARCGDGDALGRHADQPHGERSHGGRHRELHGARTPLARRPVVEFDGHRPRRRIAFRPGVRRAAERARPRPRCEPRGGQAAPAPELRLVPPDAGVGQRAVERSTVERTMTRVERTSAAPPSRRQALRRGSP